MTAPTVQCLKRLQIELRKLNMEWELPFKVGADPQNMLRCYFVMDGPADTPYEGGRYVGLIEIPSDYPFKPPSVQMCTPSGRLKTGMQICLSNSSYHPENWSPMWGLRTILIALVSFFVSEEPTTGSMSATAEERRRYAANSRKYNVKRLHAVYKRVLPEAFAADTAFIENGGTSPKDEGSSGSSASDEDATEAEAAPAGAEPEVAAQEPSTSYETVAAPARKTPGSGKAGAADTEAATGAAASKRSRHHQHKKSSTGAVAQRGGQLQWRRYASLIVLIAIGLGLLRQLM